MINNLELFGFQDTKLGLRESFQRKIDDLLELSPSDAGTFAKITKLESGYLGIMQLMSSCGKFEVRASESSLDQMQDSLFSQMYVHIKGWRKHRNVIR